MNESGVVGTAWEAWVEGVLVAEEIDGRGYRYLVVQQERGRRRLNVGRDADGLAIPESGRTVRLRARVYPRVTGGKPWDSLEWVGDVEYVGAEVNR